MKAVDLIECQDLKVRQEEHKSNQVAEKHLEHKEQAPPTGNGIVEYRSNKIESVAVFPVTSGAVLVDVKNSERSVSNNGMSYSCQGHLSFAKRTYLVDWHEDSDAPCPALKPVKELHVWRPHPTTVLVRYNICRKK